MGTRMKWFLQTRTCVSRTQEAELEHFYCSALFLKVVERAVVPGDQLMPANRHQVLLKITVISRVESQLIVGVAILIPERYEDALDTSCEKCEPRIFLAIGPRKVKVRPTAPNIMLFGHTIAQHQQRACPQLFAIGARTWLFRAPKSCR